MSKEGYVQFKAEGELLKTIKERATLEGRSVSSFCRRLIEGALRGVSEKKGDGGVSRTVVKAVESVKAVQPKKVEEVSGDERWTHGDAFLARELKRFREKRGRDPNSEADFESFRKHGF
jgi:hypothetical protein